MAVRDLAHELLRDVETTRDLSSTNLDRLIQFDDRRTFAMLVALPDVVMKELEDDRESGRAVTLKWARIAETAIAIEILNTLPVRISTLSALDLKRNFVPPSHRKGDGKLIIYGDQEKSEKRLEASLSPRTWRLISLHCRHYRPILPGADRGSLLFPTVAVVNYPWSSRFGERIALLVKKRLKVTVTTHLWRHIMGSRLQEYSDQPNDGEKLLGHIPGSDATKRYIRVRTNEAAKRLRELTDAVRSEGAKQLGYKRHRVRSRPRGGPTAPLASDD
jgi:integrase